LHDFDRLDRVGLQLLAVQKETQAENLRRYRSYPISFYLVRWRFSDAIILKWLAAKKIYFCSR
jgi:hypothetical protein